MHLNIWLLTVVIISKVKTIHQTIFLNTFFQFQTQQSASSDERSVLHEIENTSEDASEGYALPRKEGRVTVGESSGFDETSDEPDRDQPRAGQENEHYTSKDTSCQEGG